MATDQNLELLISADSSGVKTGMADAKQTVQSSTEAIKQSTQQMADQTKSAMQQMRDAFKNMASGSSEAMKDGASATAAHAQTIGNSLTGAVSGIQSQLGGLSSAIGFITKNFAALAAITAGVVVFKEGISATKEFTSEANKLARAFNISATEASTLNVALGDIYTDAETMVGASQQLSRQLRNNEEGLKSMGLQTRDSSGEYRNLKDLMLDAAKVLGDYKEGTDRALAGQVLFGKGAGDAAALMRLNTGVMEAARQKQEELGLTVGKENVEALKAYKAAMNDVGDVMLALKKTIGDAVMPIFTKFGEWLSSIGPAAVTILKGAIGGLAATFWFVKNGVTVLWETINAMIVSVTEPIRALAAALAKALTGDWAGAKNELGNIGTVIKTTWAGAMDEMYKSSEETNARVAALFNKPTDTKATDNKGKKDFVDPKDKSKPEKSQMKDYEAELAEKKVAYQEQQRIEGSFREFSKQQELDFWETKLNTVAKGTDDEKTLRLKVATTKLAIDKSSFEAEVANLKSSMAEFKNNASARLEIAQQLAERMKKAYGEDSKEYALAQKDILAAKRQVADQLKQIETEQVKTAMNRNMDLIAQEQEISDMRYQLGIQSAQQTFALEQDFESRRYQLQAKSLQDQLELAKLNPDKNPVEVEKINAQLEELEMKHQATMRGIQHKATMEQMKDWKGMFDAIQNSLASVVKGLMNGTMTMGKAIKTLFAGVLDAVVNTLAQMAAKWIMQKVIEMIWGKTAAISGVAANAAVAGSGAYAATASIPYVGPFMAPAAAATAYAGAMSFGAGLAAEKGFDVPAGMNPITQLHQKEMVLPANIAQPLRDSLDGGGGIGGGDYHLHVHATDSDSVKRLFQNNGSALMEVLRQQHRNFAG